MQGAKSKAFDWLLRLLGLSFAGAFLSKYSAVAILLIAFMAAMSVEQTRQALVRAVLLNKRGMALSVVLCSLLLSPHFLWLLYHWAESTSPIVEKLVSPEEQPYFDSVATGLSNLGIALVSFYLVPFIIFVYLALNRQSDSALPSATTGAYSTLDSALVLRFTAHYFFFFVCFCLLLILVWGTSAFRERWLVAFLFWTPAVAIVWLSTKPIRPVRVRRLLWGFVLTVGFVFALRAPLLGMANQPGWINFPSKDLAIALNSDFDRAIPVIASTMQLAGNTKLHTQEREVISPTFTFQKRHLALSRSCRLLLLRSSQPGRSIQLTNWSDPMLEAAADYWAISRTQIDTMVGQAKVIRSYSLPALYSTSEFQLEALILERQTGCERNLG